MKDRLQTKEYLASREAAIKRDGFVCRNCGSKDNLSTHHLTRFSRTQDDDPANLVTLCSSCHKKIENIQTRYGTTRKIDRWIDENSRMT